MRLRTTTSKWDKQLEKRKFECITQQCSVRAWTEENKMLYFPFLALFPSVFSHCIYIIFVYHRNKSPFQALLAYFLYLLVLFLHFSFTLHSLSLSVVQLCSSFRSYSTFSQHVIFFFSCDIFYWHNYEMLENHVDSIRARYSCTADWFQCKKNCGVIATQKPL